LLRGGEMNASELDSLVDKQGVGLIIDLREDREQLAKTARQKLTPKEEASEVERLKEKGKNVRYEQIPMSAGEAPNDDDIIKFIELIEEARRQHIPVYVHCQRGCDRTGAMIGHWRVYEDHWSYETTWAEMLAYGFDPKYKKLAESVYKQAK
jgi:protein tyrosine/serine phosphatase